MAGEQYANIKIAPGPLERAKERLTVRFDMQGDGRHVPFSVCLLALEKTLDKLKNTL